MPVSFRWILVAIMAANLITLCAWQFFFVNGILPTMRGKNKPAAIMQSEVRKSAIKQLTSIDLVLLSMRFTKGAIKTCGGPQTKMMRPSSTDGSGTSFSISSLSLRSSS
jgi:hypothetical protein